MTASLAHRCINLLLQLGKYSHVGGFDHDTKYKTLVEKSSYRPDVIDISKYYKWIIEAIEQDKNFEISFVATWLKWLNNFPKEARTILNFIVNARDDSEAHRNLEEFLQKNVPLFQEVQSLKKREQLLL